MSVLGSAVPVGGGLPHPLPCACEFITHPFPVALSLDSPPLSVLPGHLLHPPPSHLPFPLPREPFFKIFPWLPVTHWGSSSLEVFPNHTIEMPSAAPCSVTLLCFLSFKEKVPRSLKLPYLAMTLFWCFLACPMSHETHESRECACLIHCYALAPSHFEQSLA